MKNKHGFAVASLVLGICSLVFAFFAVLWIPALVGLVLAILGLIFAILARKGGDSSGAGIGGLVTSIIGIIICAIFSVACSAACLAGSYYIDTHASDIESALESQTRDFASNIDQLSSDWQSTLQ